MILDSKAFVEVKFGGKMHFSVVTMVGTEE
jgi:hypothetical protein